MQIDTIVAIGSGAIANPGMSGAAPYRKQRSSASSVPEGGAEGVLVSYGGTDGGYSLYVKDGKLQYVQNYVAREYLHVVSTERVPSGRHALRFEFEMTGKPDMANGKGAPGRGQLYIDGKLVGQADFPYTTPLSLGLTGGTKVATSYPSLFISPASFS